MGGAPIVFAESAGATSEPPAQTAAEQGRPPTLASPRLVDRLRDHWLSWRDRLLVDPRFHRFAAAFPATRPMARRRARALYDLCAGFVYSQVLAACVRLKLFDILAEGPQTAGQLAPRLGLDLDATRRLLGAAVSLQLASRRGDRRIDLADDAALFGLGELGAALRGAAGVAEMVEHHALLYADLADPVAVLRGERETSLSQYWAYTERETAGALGAEAVASYSALMAASQPFVAEEVLEAYSFRRHRRLLDVGGGEGAFLCAVAARAPRLSMTLFDLPAVAARARVRFASAGLSDRTETVGGSFFDDPLPTGADVISLIRVLYDHDDATVLKILRQVRSAAAPGTVLVVAEPMAGTPGAEPIGEAYFGFYLMAMRGGRPRTPAEIAALLEQAGFSDARLAPTRRPLLARVMTARAAPSFQAAV